MGLAELCQKSILEEESFKEWHGIWWAIQVSNL